MAFVHAARESQQERESVVGHGFVDQTRGEGDDDAILCGRREVNGVVTNAPARNDFKFRGGRGLENRCGESVHAGQDAIHVRQELQQFIGGVGARLGGDDQIAVCFAQQL